MNTRFLKLVGPALALPLALAFPALSQASFMSCTGTDYDISGFVNPSSDCAILEPIDANQNDDTGGDPSTWIVNTEAFFGFDDWLFNGKFMDNPAPTLFSFDGDAQSGTFTYLGGFDHDDVMFIFKDGGDTNLVGYLIDMDALLSDTYGGTGTYQSPFVIPPFAFSGNPPRDISHISVYYRGEGDTPPQEVPEPALLILFGTGLLAMGWVVRRRKEMNGLS